MLDTQNTMRHVRWMSRDAMRGLVAAGGLCAVAGGARADAIHPGPPSAVQELRRVSVTVGDDAGLVSADPEAIPGFAGRILSFGEVVSHSNNTRFVAAGSGGVPPSGWSQFDPGAGWTSLVPDAALPATAPTVAAVPAPGAVWLPALGILCTRRRRRRRRRA